MKITIIGGGNMGGAIAKGLVTSNKYNVKDITVINRRQEKADELKGFNKHLNSVVNDYTSINNADIVIIALKPWMIESFLKDHKCAFSNPKQILLSVAAGISLQQLTDWTYATKPVYVAIPNTAIAVKQSMTAIAAANSTKEQDEQVVNMFSELGHAILIDEKLLSAVTALASCGIAFVFRYVRACMEAGIEMGIYPNKARDIMIQTLRGAAELLEANGSHPEVEIDKVTTAGGITIKGLNELEHSGFTSAVIKGLKATNV